MAELKTKKTEGSVETFLDSIDDERSRDACRTVLDIMKKATREEPKLWGTNIVGFGHYHYKYASGREGEWFLTGFSPRKQNLTLYIMAGFEQYPELMEKLGKHKTGKSCLYIRNLADIDLDVLKELVALSVEHMRTKN